MPQRAVSSSRVLVICINYVFIENDKDVSAWVLSNAVLKPPLDLFVYCHRRYTADRVATPPFKTHHYLREYAIANWAGQSGACTSIQAPRKGLRPDPSPVNAGGNQANGSPLCLPVSSSSSPAVSNAGDGCEAIMRTSPSPISDPTESPHFRIPLAIQSLSKINTHNGWDVRGRRGETPDVKVLKRGAPSDSED